MWNFPHKPLVYLSVALPALFLMVEVGLVWDQMFPAPVKNDASMEPPGFPDTVIINAERFAYRSAGSYLQNGQPVDPRIRTEILWDDLEITTDLVSVSDYRRCVDANACNRPDISASSAPDLPVTGVSYTDANAYATWLSDKTGQKWRLPSDKEWTFAAGSRAVDDAIGETDANDPSGRWLAAYRKVSAVDRSVGATPLPIGSFGENENGLTDVSGNVWEWTPHATNG